MQNFINVVYNKGDCLSNNISTVLARLNFLELLDVFLIFCVTVVVNRHNILYTSYSSIFTIFYTTFWETSLKDTSY